MKIKLFLVVCLVYELTSLRVNKLFVAIMICVIRSLFFTRRDGETEVGSKATEVPMAQGEIASST